MTQRRYFTCPHCQGSVLSADEDSLLCPVCGKGSTEAQQPRAARPGRVNWRKVWIAAQLLVVAVIGVVVYLHFKGNRPEPKKIAEASVPVERERPAIPEGERAPPEPKAEPKGARPKPPNPTAPAAGGLPSGQPGPIVGAEEAAARELALVHRLVVEGGAKAEAARRAFVVQCKSSGLRPMLDPAGHLSGGPPPGIDEALAATLRAQKDGEARSSELLDDLRRALRSAPVGPAARSRGMDFLAPLVQQESSTWADAKLACQNSQSALPVLAAHLIRTRGTWSASSNRVIFQRPADQTRFDEAAAALRKAAGQWDRVEQAMHAPARVPPLAGRNG